MALLAGAVLVQTGFAPVSAIHAAPMMAMQEDCCPNDCPDMPECSVACISTMQCRMAPAAVRDELAGVYAEPTLRRMGFFASGMIDIRQYAGSGLRKPPKA